MDEYRFRTNILGIDLFYVHSWEKGVDVQG